MKNPSDLKNAYALIIGISKYSDTRIPELNYTRADAEAIYGLLIDPEKVGLNRDKVKVLLDEEATGFNIKSAITDWLFKNADNESIVFIYFAGHGGVEEDRLGIEKDGLSKYMLPYDSVFDNLYASALSNRDFNELLLSIRSRKLVIFLDSCYAGGVSERNVRDVKITEDPYQKVVEGKGRVVIAASQPNQRSFEDAEIGHGIFTHHLLEALSGRADRDNDGYVTVLDAYKYLVDAVPRSAKQLAGGAQEPVLRGDIAKDFVISVNRQRFEEIQEERVREEKLNKLWNFYNSGKLSGKHYERIRTIIKSDPSGYNKKDETIAKLTVDLLSGNISITTFLEDLKNIEPELFEKNKKQKEEQERLRKEEEKEKSQEEKKELEQQLGEEEKQKQKEEKEKLRKEKEVQEKQLEEKQRIQKEERERLKNEVGGQKRHHGIQYGNIGKKLIILVLVLAILLVAYWLYSPDLTERKTVKKGDIIFVDYTGRLENGDVFDTSIENVAKENDIFQPGSEYIPLQFTVGAGSVIQGFDEGVIGMNVGDSKTMTIPPEEAYGQIDPSLIRVSPIIQVISNTFPRVIEIPLEEFEKAFGAGHEVGDIVEVPNEDVKMTIKKINSFVSLSYNYKIGDILPSGAAPWKQTVTKIDENNIVLTSNLKKGETVQFPDVPWNSTVIDIDTEGVTLKHNAIPDTELKTYYGPVSVRFNETSIIMDNNHKLAGKTLIFDITLKSIEEELVIDETISVR